MAISHKWVPTLFLAPVCLDRRRLLYFSSLLIFDSFSSGMHSSPIFFVLSSVHTAPPEVLLLTLSLLPARRPLPLT